jgi:hypothetical protein
MASRPFEAKYPGDCCECGIWWEEGELIRYNDNEELVHKDCYVFEKPAYSEPRTFKLKRAEE